MCFVFLLCLICAKHLNIWNLKYYEAEVCHLLRSVRAPCGQAQGQICYEVVVDAEGCRHEYIHSGMINMELFFTLHLQNTTSN